MIVIVFRFAFLTALATLTSVAQAQPASAAGTFAPTCAATALSLSVSPSDDDGAMHDAMNLKLVNSSGAACSVPGHPHVSLIDKRGRAIVANATVAAPRFMHPGPVIVPRTIEPGASLTTEIRWLRDNGNASPTSCSTIAIVVLENARAPLASTVCSDDTRGAKPRLDVKLYQKP